MAVPYVFSLFPGGSSIPLADLDANFAYLTNNPTITGNLTVSGNLSVAQSSTFTGPVTMGGGLSLMGPLTYNGISIPFSGVTGTGLWVFNDGPTLISPILGTPVSGNLQNCSNYPIVSVTGLGFGVLPFLASPSSATLAGCIPDRSGSGSLVFNTNPSFINPALNVPSSGDLRNCQGYPAANLTGNIPISKGGTSASNAPDALNNLLPAQGLNAGKVLATNGTNAYWESNTSGSVTSVNVSGGSTGLTFTGGPITTSGTMTMLGTLDIDNGGTGQTTRQAAINTLVGSAVAGTYLRGNGSDVVMATIPASDIPTLNQNTTGSAATFTSTTQNSQFNSVGVGVVASNVAGQVNATQFIDATGTLRPLVLMPSQTAAGSQVTFTGIPSWVNAITVVYAAVVVSGTAQPILQLGTSAGMTTTGYSSGGNLVGGPLVSSTVGFSIGYATNPDTYTVAWRVNRVAGNQWVCTVTGVRTSDWRPTNAAGTVTLPGQITQLACTFDAATTFGGGVISVSYE